MVCIYCTYLTFSAVAMEPDDKQCNPLIRASKARKTTIIMGAFITFATVAYTTTRAATYGLALGTGKPAGGYHQVGVDEGEHGLIDRQPDSRRDDERTVVQHNYTLFHVIFLLSTMWAATLLTQQISDTTSESFHPVGRTYFNSWTKIVSSWVCYIMFGWTLLAPVALPDRFDY